MIKLDLRKVLINLLLMTLIASQPEVASQPNQPTEATHQPTEVTNQPTEVVSQPDAVVSSPASGQPDSSASVQPSSNEDREQ